MRVQCPSSRYCNQTPWRRTSPALGCRAWSDSVPTDSRFSPISPSNTSPLQPTHDGLWRAPTIRASIIRVLCASVQQAKTSTGRNAAVHCCYRCAAAAPFCHCRSASADLPVPWYCDCCLPYNSRAPDFVRVRAAPLSQRLSDTPRDMSFPPGPCTPRTVPS